MGRQSFFSVIQTCPDNSGLSSFFPVMLCLLGEKVYCCITYSWKMLIELKTILNNKKNMNTRLGKQAHNTNGQLIKIKQMGNINL